MSVPFIFEAVSCLARFIYLFFWQGYGGGDEVNMLQRHLLGTPTKFGVGANRAAVACHFIKKYGYVDARKSSWYEKVHGCLDSEKIGVVVLDDAMQVMQLFSSLPPFFVFDLLFHDFLINNDSENT